MVRVVVLRYGHRHVRDYRVTSHCCLVARAFGASRIEVIGEEDPKIRETLEEINSNWGMGASLSFYREWRPRVEHYREEGYEVVHLTMYGMPIQSLERELRKKERLLVIIGSQKVEKEVYEISDYNVSVTLQPHSEIAALAVVLDRLFEGKGLAKKFSGARVSVEPAEHGKKIKRK